MDKLSFKIVALNENNIDECGAFCLQSKKNTKGYKEKFEWIKERFKEGLRLRLLLVNEGRNGGSEQEGSSSIFLANTRGAASKLTDTWSFIASGLLGRTRGTDTALDCFNSV
jgi:hypothetical protein